MWSFFYLLAALILVWLLARLFIWQIAKYVKTKFNVDIIIKSVGFFSAKDITLRVNQLQTIEVDKISLQLKLFERDARHLVSLRVGELRVRAEMAKVDLSPTFVDVQSSDSYVKTHKRSGSFARKRIALISLVQKLFKYASVHVDVLNVMLLHALVPDSLVHINLTGILLTSDGSLAGNLKVENMDGKILKSPKEVSEVASCIAEISSSLEMVVVAEQLYPSLELTSIDAELKKLQIELHEGALIPGILLPRLAVPKARSTEEQSVGAAEFLKKLHHVVDKITKHLPTTSSLSIRSFGIAFFGDETMGETTRGAHVVASQIVLRQFKDSVSLVPVKFGEFPETNFNVPSGYIRLQVDDVTMTDYYKRKVGEMGKTVLETKLNANGVLSNSLDFTSWHADYKHKESALFWNIIFNKLREANRLQAVFEQTTAANLRPDKHSGESSTRTTGSASPAKPTFRRSRIVSAPDSVTSRLAPDILEGTESASYAERGVETSTESEFNFPSLLRAAGISIVFECTVYDASIDVVMTPLISSGNDTDFPPGFSIGLDSLTGIVDESAQSRDLNFMLKLENFWCVVEQDGDDGRAGKSENTVGKAHPSFRNGVHQWGQSFTVENLRLHGSGSFKQPISTPLSAAIIQQVSLLIDAKVVGLQVELSKCAAQALQSFLNIAMPAKRPVTSEDCSASTRISQKQLRRQATSVDCNTPLQLARNERSKSRTIYQYTVACIDVELSRVNAFILSSDDMRCGECFVARLDQFKVEVNGGNTTSGEDDAIDVTRNVSLAGVALTTVHNPYFSAFAKYEAGRSGGIAPDKKISASMRRQQTQAAEYMCVDAANMFNNFLAFDVLEVGYGIKYDIDDREENFRRENPMSFDQQPNNNSELSANHSKDRPGRVVRQLSVNLTSEERVVLCWTPALHALLHYEIAGVVRILAPFTTRNTARKTNEKPQKSMYDANGDHATSVPSGGKIQQASMRGDASNSAQKRPGFWELHLSLTPLDLQLNITDTKTFKLSLAPLTCNQTEHITTIACKDVAIVMDKHKIFSFSNNVIELATWNAVCHMERKNVSDLKTTSNRAWTFNMDSWKCHFPYKYDFAATFDQTITTWKWVKGLYRKKSHPFRSARLPPDLLINISHFTFEIDDWEFECRLRDNHELMMDEWTESEKRRRVLDQRIAGMRKERGEILPAKQVEDLYHKLNRANISIYLSRSREMYRQPTRIVLFTWTVSNFKLSVLADESMHGMRNAMETIRKIDEVSPFPFENNDGDDPEFVTLWCRYINLHASRHQVRLRNYPQCLMDYTDWKVYGKFCGAEQNGPPTAKRTEYVPLPAPWEPAAVLRNMPALKFYHDLSNEVHTFNMAWGPCWDPAWSQVNLALNLLTKLSVDPSNPLPWWDKSRMLFHGRFAMSMDRVNMLHLASFDPYNTTEHMHWDWKNMYMDWTPGCFLFKGDLDIHIRNASKYDDVRFLHLPRLKMECSFDWVCLDGANPHDHHRAVPHAPDKLEGEVNDHDSYRYFRSRNIDLSINLETRSANKGHVIVSDTADPSSTKPSNDHVRPEVLLYSTTLRWLRSFGIAINAVARPICKGSLFANQTRPKLKLSRHYRNVKTSFVFSELKVRYWSSYAKQLGIEWLCGTGEVDVLFKLTIVPYDTDLIRRSLGDWSVASTSCELRDTKIYLLKRQDSADVAQSPTSRPPETERNFFLSLSKMSYRRDNVNDGVCSPISPAKPRTLKDMTRTPSRNEFDESRYRRTSKRQKKPSSPTKRKQNRQNLIIHDLKAMWTTENRDIGYGLYDSYSKAAILRRNLSTKILSKFRIGPATGDENDVTSRRSSQMTPDSETGSSSMGQEGMDPNLMLRKLLDESGSRSVVGTEELSTEQQQLKGITACNMDDVVNKNWLIKFVNCQAMLKGPKSQGYMILTAAQAEFLNREHRVTWRNGQLTTKSSWLGSLTSTQVFATVEKNVQSSGQEGDNVPWLSVSDIAPRGPSPGMLDISHLMSGGQAIGGVVGDGVSAGSYQLQRIMSRCTCQMYYVGYEALIDSEQTDYGHLLPETPAEDDKALSAKHRLGGNDLLNNEKPVNILTIVQPDLEICTNTSQFNMILDIVENLLLYVEPGLREFYERVDSMRFKLRLTSADDAAKQRDTLAAMQNRIRSRLTNMRQLERQLFRLDRGFDSERENQELYEQIAELSDCLKDEKETLNVESEELGIIIRLMEQSKRPGVVKTIAHINGECLAIRNDRPKMNSFLLLLSSYFGEDATQLFKSFEDGPMEDILMKIPLSPFIIIQGGTTTTAKEFVVAIERCIVAKFETFLKAVRYSFCSFFVMNMEYPRKSALTMEFVQRCLKEMFLERKTSSSTMRLLNRDLPEEEIEEEEEEASVARTTEVTFGHVKWHLTDADGQLNIAQFEMKNFLYEKINKSDDTVSHCFELGHLTLQNLLPNSLYRDVIKLHHQMGLRSHGVSGAGGRSLTFRVICKVRPPVGGISVKDHVEVNAAPLTIQLTYQFFKRMMSFFFPDKGAGAVGEESDTAVDSKSASLLGVSSSGPPERQSSIRSLPTRPPPPSPSIPTAQPVTPSGNRKNKSFAKAIDDVDKMKERAAKNNTFLYIKVTQVPLCVSYKGEKEKNIEDAHEFNLTIPMLEYHSMTWTWHDFAMAVKRDCKKQLVSQLIKEKLHLGGRSHNQPSSSGSADTDDSTAAADETDKAKMLLGNTLKRSGSQKRSIFKWKK